MGEHIHPPKSELMNPKLARKADGSDMWWRNMLENPETAIAGVGRAEASLQRGPRLLRFGGRSVGGSGTGAPCEL